MELTGVEQMAFAMLQSQPQELQRIAPSGSLEIVDLHRYFHRVSHLLDMSERKRVNDFIDVEVRYI
jgi:hypothetical protein